MTHAKASLREQFEVEIPEPIRPRPTPRKPRRTQAERTALSDSLMIDVAKQLIVERGTHGFTLKEVGERAGFSRGLASNRFGSKEALFSQLIVRFNASWTQELANQVGTRTGAQACLAALRAVEGFLSSHSDYMQAMYILWFESITSHSDVRTHLSDYHAIYRRDIALWVREGIENGEIDASVDPDTVAFQFCSFIFGTIYQWLVTPKMVNLAQHFEAYRRTVERLLKS